MDISGMRVPYKDRTTLLLEQNLQVKDPFDLFDKWFREVQNDKRFVEPNAMCLSTATKDGAPSARFVLLKGYGTDGFRFFTHYTSRKGLEMEENPKVALTFYWDHLSRSVRIEGVVEQLPISAGEEYFQTRSYNSQIGALCSDQSKPISGRDVLTNNEKRLKLQYTEGNVPRPPKWGGYLVKPHSIEFWQGQTDRIHDRIRFRRPNETEPDNVVSFPGENGWIYERLAP